MNKPTVRCRCGHQVLGREVLRTDFYERASGREMVYVKYRCRRCKRLGEAFIAQEEWDWSIFEAPRNEMSDAERDRFLDEQNISAGDVLNFHRDLKRVHNLSDLMGGTDAPRSRSKTDVKEKGDNTKGRRGNGGPNSEKHRRPGPGN